jgi:tRNA(Ile)-lysidine synthase TilS/MesJ
VVDKNASSIEQDAREKRYGVISKVFNDYGVWDAVLTGHHKNDNIETAFFNILRGGELSSMDGIKQTDTIFGFKIIRPALRFTRMELTEYLASIGCTNWNEDESNFDVAYSRNFLRHQIIPQLKTHFSGFDQSMLNFISRAQLANEYKQRFLDSFFEGNVTDFNTLYEYYNDTSSEGVVLQDIAISVVNFGATKMSKAFLTRAQLIDLCRRLFTIKDGKTKKVNSFYVDKTFVCNRGYNNSDSRNMVLSFHEVNPERNKEGHR